MKIPVIKILDTTLRDGEQTPGVCLMAEEKLEIAHALAKQKIDIIEAGFPAASNGDFDAVSQIASKIKGPVIAGLARAIKKDIDMAWQALSKAERARIHTFIATSDIHMEYKLKMTRDQVLNQADEAIRYARCFTDDVEFSAEDATRSDWDFLCQLFSIAIAAGATTITVADTVGYIMPEELGNLIKYIKNNVMNIDQAIISVHCHDDLGMAVANSLAAIKNGATQVECTVNGIGERAGNAAIEEVVLALKTRKDFYHVRTNVDTTQIYQTSHLVSALTSIIIPPNKAVVGDNAFAHESGIHQHGVLNNYLTYEIIRPKSIGVNGSTIVLGKHSGRHAFEDRIRSMGYELDNETIKDLFSEFKALADQKKCVSDLDIEAIIHNKARVQFERYRLVYYHVISGNHIMDTASVQMETNDGNIKQGSCCGADPVDATFKAIEAAIGINENNNNYIIRTISASKDDKGEAVVWLECNGKTFSGRGLSVDIIEARARAYISAINKMVAVCGLSEQVIGKEVV